MRPGTKDAPSKARLARVTFTFFGEGVRYVVKSDALAGIDTTRFTVLDLSENPRAKAFAGAVLAGIEPGIRRLGEVPVNVAAPLDSADVAICKEGKGNWALEVEEYLGRSPQDGFPAAIHYRLPAEPYAKAHLLVAVDPDPAKDPVLTVRLGHYVHNGSGGNMLADAVLELKDGKFPESFRQVGTVKHKGRDIPLMHGTIDLPIGRVLDLAARRDFVDFEFIGRRWVNFQQIDNSMKPDPQSDSAFNVFGVTLEKAPVLMDVEQSQPGNLAVSFDGWGYVHQSLRLNTLVPTHSPGPVSDQWVSEGGDKTIDFPIKVRAITVGMNRTKLDLLDFKPSAPAIRLKDVGGVE